MSTVRHTEPGKRRDGRGTLAVVLGVQRDRKRLSANFIERWIDLHRVRQLSREGERVLVFQGLGGLGNA